MKGSDIKWLSAYFILLAALFLLSPKRHAVDPFIPQDFPGIIEAGKVTAITVEGVDSYFTFKGTPHGHQYELIKAFADSHGLKLEIIVAETVEKLREMLLDGEGEIVAHRICWMEADEEKFISCGLAGDSVVSSWIVRKTMPALAVAIDEWFDVADLPATSKKDRFLFERSKLPGDEPAPMLGEGRISIYDSLFKHYAAEINWDWMLLASIAFQESKFYTDLTSGEGATGLMGIMPGTAKLFGLPEDSVFNPEANLRTAVRLIERLNRSFSEIKDHSERQKFIIASYNAGAGHINDARALAGKYGKDPSKWKDTEDFLRRLKEEEFYNDTVCRAGAFNAGQTLFYLESVIERWDYYKKDLLCLEEK
ncbi:MAG: transglycosylase SLT domain-containing protein [Dysgonamonadaceae bacterium]|jgi:membrane-bound lytic murein transglycosylase F|nr:transglycosylase SLT domain-containing protein [Dysgonamonadaceae bacterium]